MCHLWVSLTADFRFSLWLILARDGQHYTNRPPCRVGRPRPIQLRMKANWR